MFPGISVLTCSSQCGKSVQSELHSLNSSVSLTLVLWFGLLWCVLWCIFSLYDLFLLQLPWLLCLVSLLWYLCLCLSVLLWWLLWWEEVLFELLDVVDNCFICSKNCLRFVWLVQAYLCCCYLTYCGVHMYVCDLVWDCYVAFWRWGQSLMKWPSFPHLYNCCL